MQHNEKILHMSDELEDRIVSGSALSAALIWAGFQSNSNNFVKYREYSLAKKSYVASPFRGRFLAYAVFCW